MTVPVPSSLPCYHHQRDTNRNNDLCRYIPPPYARRVQSEEEVPVYGEVFIASVVLPAAVVAKYRTSTSSSCCSFSKLGRICCCMISCPLGDGLAASPDFSSDNIVPLEGRRLSTSIKTAYDFATLNRMLGMSSATSLSIIGRIDFSITSRLMAGASVYVAVSTNPIYVQMRAY